MRWSPHTGGVKLTLLVFCACAAVVSSSSSPASLSQQGPSGICACAAYTYDSKECQAAASAYCKNSTADAAVCSGIRDLQQLRTSEAAASAVAGYLGSVCKPANASIMDTCTCFTDPTSDLCTFTRLRLCTTGDPLCPAISLGQAATADQKAYGKKYYNDSCQINAPLDVELVFAGINQTTYNTRYAAKTAAALANITGVEVDQISYNQSTAAPVLEKPVVSPANSTETAAIETEAAKKPTAAVAEEKEPKEAAAPEPAPEQEPTAEPAEVAAQVAAQPEPEPEPAPVAEPKPIAKEPAPETAVEDQPVVKEAAPEPAAVKSEPVAEEPVSTAVEPATAAEDAAAEATAKAKDFDAWAATPACNYPQTARNAKFDRLGRPWGYNSATGESCPFRASAAPAPPAYQDAPDCQYKLTATNALPDKLGRLWGYDDATGTSCVFRGQSLAPPPAPPAAPAPVSPPEEPAPAPTAEVPATPAPTPAAATSAAATSAEDPDWGSARERAPAAEEVPSEPAAAPAEPPAEEQPTAAEPVETVPAPTEDTIAEPAEATTAAAVAADEPAPPADPVEAVPTAAAETDADAATPVAAPAEQPNWGAARERAPAPQTEPPVGDRPTDASGAVASEPATSESTTSEPAPEESATAESAADASAADEQPGAAAASPADSPEPEVAQSAEPTAEVSTAETSAAADAAAEPDASASASEPVGTATRGSRKMLLQVLLPDATTSSPNSTILAMMKFTIPAADAAKARAKLISASQNDGEAFYDALTRAGVPLRPSLAMSGQKLLAGDVPPSINITSRSGVMTYYDAAALGLVEKQPIAAPAAVSGSNSGLTQSQLIGIIVGAAVGGAALLGLLAWCCCCRRRTRKSPAERLKEEEEAAAAAKLGATKQPSSYGAALRDQFAEAQKPSDQRAILTAPETPTSPGTRISASSALGVAPTTHGHIVPPALQPPRV